MRARVLVEIECNNYHDECANKVQTSAEIVAHIGSGGHIEVDFDPTIPAGWEEKRWHGLRCPECLKETP